MVGQREFMDVHDAWVRGKSIREIARLTGRDRKTIRRLLHVGASSQRKPRQTSSKLDPFREYLLGRMVGEDAVSNAEVLDDEIREMGYRGGRSISKSSCIPSAPWPRRRRRCASKLHPDTRRRSTGARSRSLVASACRDSS